jgi:DNA-binding HxlR family transcriptional regulator
MMQLEILGGSMRRTSLKTANCPVARSLDVIGDWWSLLIVRDAFRGLRRFGQFRNSLGLARNILTVRLRGLVADGILRLAPTADGSAYQDYVLTQKGRDLLPVLVALRQWGMKNFPDGGPWDTELVDRDTGRTVQGVALQADDGCFVSADALELRSVPVCCARIFEAGDQQATKRKSLRKN